MWAVIKRVISNIILSLTNSKLFKHIEFNVFRKIVFSKLKNYSKNVEPRLFWGPIPILNNKYWSNALKEDYSSYTIMNEYYNEINNISDFDYYAEDVLAKYHLPKFLLLRYKHFFLTFDLLKNYDVMHIPFSGAFLGPTEYWHHEAEIFKKLGKKIVVLPYGSDAYIYSKVKNTSFQNALLISYPISGRMENGINQRVDYWTEQADFIPGGFMIDGFPRWDCVVGNFVVIENPYTKTKKTYSNADGTSGLVKIAHCPNHRGAKGTEFLVDAINQLKRDGLKIELVLFENVKNSKILESLHFEIDILVEQLILGYGLNAIEGMSSGVVTISNLSNDEYSLLFRRYGTLNECPIVTATPESIKEVLYKLITNPKLRRELGELGKQFSAKYHSPEFARYFFGMIYKKIWFNENVDLMNLFHPLNPKSYNNSKPLIKHPLINNHIVDDKNIN